MRATCVELTGVLGLGDPRHLRPLVATDGPVLWPLDRAIIALVWGGDGYPSRGALPRLPPPHHATATTPGATTARPMTTAPRVQQARADAAEFVAHVRRRVAGGGVCVCALDTELLGPLVV